MIIARAAMNRNFTVRFMFLVSSFCFVKKIYLTFPRLRGGAANVKTAPPAKKREKPSKIIKIIKISKCRSNRRL
jgi:hypothetical protein